MSTTETENRRLTRRLIEEVWSEGNVDVIDELCADDYVMYTNQAPEPVRGPDEFKELVSRNRTAFPDLEVTVEETIAEGDTVVSRTRNTGTHQGEFMGIEATGADVETQTISITRIEDGTIVESRVQHDLLDGLQQLGVVDRPDA